LGGRKEIRDVVRQIHSL